MNFHEIPKIPKLPKTGWWLFIYTETVLIACDQKRIRLHHSLFSDKSSTPAATQEAMLLHVSKKNGIPSASPIREPLSNNLDQIRELHSEIVRPGYLGRGIRQI